MTPTPPHHEIFRSFPCCGGAAPAGFAVNFLGVRMRRRFFPDGWWDDLGTSPTQHPPFSEDYFEWVDVLTAAAAASGTFRMAYLGAGFGRWLLSGAAAVARRGLEARLVGVEAEPTHFRWMERAFRDNGHDPRRHRLIRAAVGGAAGEAFFTVGKADAWYGQAVVPAPVGGPPPRRGLFRSALALLGLGRREEVRAQKVPCVTLDEALRGEGTVDLLDADVQGAEADVFESAAGRVDAQVKRVHIGTHSTEQETRLRALFGGLGWRPVHDYPFASHNETPYGVLRFQDGVQSWVNPRFRP
jgi:FkbM family methyltransferase